MSWHHRRHHCHRTQRDWHWGWYLIVGVLIMFSACDDHPTPHPSTHIEQETPREHTYLGS